MGDEPPLTVKKYPSRKARRNHPNHGFQQLRHEKAIALIGGTVSPHGFSNVNKQTALTFLHVASVRLHDLRYSSVEIAPAGALFSIQSNLHLDEHTE